jgi:hypothetical protein
MSDPEEAQMDRRTMLASLLGGAALALGAVGRKEAAAGVVQFRAPFSGVFTDDCNSEDVAYQGICHVLSVLNFDQHGGSHIDVQTNCHMDAVGLTSGRRYVVNEGDHFSFNSRSPIPLEITQLMSWRAISQGAADNLTIRSQMHLTVNARGQVSVFFSDFSADCKG